MLLIGSIIAAKIALTKALSAKLGAGSVMALSTGTALTSDVITSNIVYSYRDSKGKKKKRTLIRKRGWLG